MNHSAWNTRRARRLAGAEPEIPEQAQITARETELALLIGQEVHDARVGAPLTIRFEEAA